MVTLLYVATNFAFFVVLDTTEMLETPAVAVVSFLSLTQYASAPLPYCRHDRLLSISDVWRPCLWHHVVDHSCLSSLLNFRWPQLADLPTLKVIYLLIYTKLLVISMSWRYNANACSRSLVYL